jgi:hypothetical protein
MSVTRRTFFQAPSSKRQACHASTARDGRLYGTALVLEEFGHVIALSR